MNGAAQAFFQGGDRASRRLAGAWLLLAVAAIGLSTLCAVFLVAARAPVLGGAAPAAVFRSALVLHVGMAVVAWFLCAACGLWTMTATRAPREGEAALRWTAFWIAAVGIAAMMASPLAGPARPVLANYLPVLDSPVFLFGMGAFLYGVGVTAALTLLPDGMPGPRVRRSVLRIAARAAAAALLVALGLLVAGLLSNGLPHEVGRFELLGWGPGHAMQFVHVLTMMCAWLLLAGCIGDGLDIGRRTATGLVLAAFLPLLAAPAIQALVPLDSQAYRLAFTRLMAWGLWPAPAGLGLLLLWRLRRLGREARTPEGVALALSVLLFLAGCAIGAAIRSETTMVPAHYHGTVGAVTLACMALGRRMLPSFGLAPVAGRLAAWQPAMYGAGLVLLVAGLAWSGWIGVPRKTPHADIVARFPAYVAAMSLAVAGGALAVGGAALFVISMLRSAAAGWRVHGIRAAAGVAGVAVAAGLAACQPSGDAAVAAVPRGGAGEIAGEIAALAKTPQAAAHARQALQEEIASHFHIGVARLAQKDYGAAAISLHRVLRLAPDMPEAHVNMGFAMLGLKRFKEARDFFDVATNLRPRQANAYYGLALSLEGLNDYGGALGAMRSYVHLAKEDDPFARRANAAIWEWEEAVRLARRSMDARPRRDAGEPATAIPGIGSGAAGSPAIGNAAAAAAH